MPKRKGTGIDVDRLGSWYQPNKARKLTPVDRVTAIMAPRLGVTGAEARDKLMDRTLANAPKVGNRQFKRVTGGKVGPRRRKRKMMGGMTDEEFFRMSPAQQVEWAAQTRAENHKQLNAERSRREERYTALSNDDKNRYNQNIYKESQKRDDGKLNKEGLWELLYSATWQDFVAMCNEQGVQPNEDDYRAWRLGKWHKNKDAREKYDGVGGFFNGVVDAWKDGAPQGLADLANIVGKVLPGANNITDKIEDKLSTGPHSWELLGGPVEKLVNAGSQLGKKALGQGVKLNKVNRLMPRESKIGNTKGHGVVYPIPDIKLNPELAKVIAMATGSSPLDKTDEKNSLPNLLKHHINLIKNYKSGGRRVPGLNPRRKITKGGRTFVSLRNILVTPEAAP